MDNKKIFARNLQRYMTDNGKSRKDVSEAIGVSYYTLTDWVKGKKYPRMDRVEQLADYFGILKSDLIEEKTEEHRKIQKKNDTLSDIILRLRADEEFFDLVKTLSELDAKKLNGVKIMISAFSKAGK